MIKEKSLKIILLWGLFIVSITCHSLLEMMPLFFGVDIAVTDTKGITLSSMSWFTLAFYLIPMIMIVGVIFIENKSFKIFNFVLSVIFTLMNAGHLIGLFTVPEIDGVQIVLLSFTFLSGILLNKVSFNWLKE